MSIGAIITVLSKITTITSTVKSIVELVDKIYSEPEKKKEYQEHLGTLCGEALREIAVNGKVPEKKILTPEEENIIRNALNEGKLDDKQALICRLALEDNFVTLEMVVRNLKKD